MPSTSLISTGLFRTGFGAPRKPSILRSSLLATNYSGVGLSATCRPLGTHYVEGPSGASKRSATRSQCLPSTKRSETVTRPTFLVPRNSELSNRPSYSKYTCTRAPSSSRFGNLLRDFRPPSGGGNSDTDTDTDESSNNMGNASSLPSRSATYAGSQIPSEIPRPTSDERSPYARPEVDQTRGGKSTATFSKWSNLPMRSSNTAGSFHHPSMNRKTSCLSTNVSVYPPSSFSRYSGIPFRNSDQSSSLSSSNSTCSTASDDSGQSRSYISI